MKDFQVLGLIVSIAAFAAGFGLGHLRGQCVGIKWYSDRDEEISRVKRYLPF